MATIIGENLAPGPGQGLATVLRPDYTPLRIMQQGDAMRARRAAADAALKQKKAADIARQWAEDRKLGLDTGGLFQQPFNDYTANAQDIIGKNFADEEAGRITTAERIQANANYKNEVERERLLGIDKDKLLATYETSQAAKPFRDMQGLHTALGETVIDPATGQRVRASAYDERANLTKLDADPRTYNADPIIGDYYKGLQASTVDEASAGRIGGINSSSSLTYKGLIPVKRNDGTWDVKRDAVGRPVLSITKDELATARASNHNLNMAVSRLRNEYDNQRKGNTNLPEKSDLDLFQEASQKYVSFRQADSEGRNAQPRAAAAGGKLKASDAVATPTASFNLSTYQDAAKPGTTQRNNYFGVGHTLASEKAPNVPVTVNSKDMTILGEDGRASHANKKQVNSQVKMAATNRQLILNVNGRRLGLSQIAEGQDAYQEMVKAIDAMTPAQARTASLQMVYHGGITDKPRISGDGRGGDSKIVAYKDRRGRLLTDTEAKEAKDSGEAIQPVYDVEEVQSAVMVPATQEIDAQVARQTPGFNPRKYSEQQADLVRRLEAKGGRIVTPYHSSKQPAATTPARPSFLGTKAAAPKPTTQKSTKTAGSAGNML